MTFHTFEVGSKLEGHQFKKINIIFKTYEKKYYKDAHVTGRKIFDGLSNGGILIYLYKRKILDDGFIYYISYRINPTRIIDGTDYENLFHTNNAYKICKMVNQQLHMVSEHLPKIEECILQRFDFCSNIILKNNKEVGDFIQLINASYLPNDKFTQKVIYNKNTGRNIIPKEEATFYRKDYVEISVYNKINQLNSEKLPMHWHENILRCEIRCQKRYIDNLKRKFKVSTIEEFFDTLPEIGTYVFESQLKKLGLSNTYLHLDDIKRVIDSTSYKSKTKKKMKAFSEAAATHKGIMNAVENDIIPTAGTIIKKFSEINIQPMPMPYRSSIESGTNLLELCLKFADIKHLIY